MSSDTCRRAFLLAGSMVATVLLLRFSLWVSPNADFNIGSYNIHHLFTGLLFITLGALPLVLFQGNSRWLDVSVLALGAGLGMALDEWVYLIATDGSNASYLLPVSFWGAVSAVGLTLAYFGILLWLRIRQETE